MLKMRLNCRDRLDRVWFVMKTKQGKDLTDSRGAVYAENEIELSQLIGSSVVCD